MLSDAAKTRICMYGAVVLLAVPVPVMLLTGRLEPPHTLVSVSYVVAMIALLFGVGYFGPRATNRRDSAMKR